jgi:glycosyltransferase involved in cell wall biosynthesis
MENKPVVSVSMITYGHENYIAQAIEGVLMQECDFEIELILANDCSPDNTDAIVQGFLKNHPRGSCIKYIKHDKNIGMMSNGNFAAKQCKGKYIAICEGDDYWTDPLKLQKQVDFLESNLEYSACAHQSELIFENSNKANRMFRNNILAKIEMKDVIEGRLFHTASIVFRTEIIKRYPLPMNIISLDRALFLLLASCGPIHFLNDVMCVYRKNEGGVSTKIKCCDLLKDLNMALWIQGINKNFPVYKFKSFIHYTAISYPSAITIKEFLVNYFYFAYYSFSFFPLNLFKLASFTFKVVPRDIIPKITK